MYTHSYINRSFHLPLFFILHALVLLVMKIVLIKNSLWDTDSGRSYQTCIGLGGGNSLISTKILSKKKIMNR